MNTTTSSAKSPGAKRLRKFAREPQGGTKYEASSSASTSVANECPIKPDPKSKTTLLLEMLTRPAGATLHQMVEATAWLPHTTRAALTGLKKKGHDVTSTKADGLRTYRVATPLDMVGLACVPAEAKTSA